MTQIAGVLFDKDGVFVDFEKTWTPVIRAIANDVSGGDAGLANRLLHAAGFDAAADIFLPGSVWGGGHADDLVEVWQPLLGNMTGRQIMNTLDRHCLSAQAHPVLPVDQQRDVFAALKAGGLVLGVATNDSTASARATVASFGMADIFDIVLGYDAVANPKPAGDPVLAFASATGLQPGQVMMVGDNTHDMHCGRAGGAGVCVGVLSGNSRHGELAPLADHVIADISELEGLVASLKHGAQIQR